MAAARDVDETPMQYPEPRGLGYSTPSYEYLETQQYVAADDLTRNADSLRANEHKFSATSAVSGATTQKNGHDDHVEHDYAIPSTTGAQNNNNSRASPTLLSSLKRKSIDVNTDQGSSSRKRSKVSRACDQCRKKKIRCDADTDSTGQLKTCTNCQKSGQTCEYSRIPQKRGPSKGYIKELSERVQQVEGELARAAYRGSLDSQAGEPPFSPDDESTLRRVSSFSQQKSPFADFARERFPSVGGWHSPSITSNPRNFSIAVPPDQIEPVRDKRSSTKTINPFWTEWIGRPSRVNGDPLHKQEFSLHDKMSLQHYYDVVHTTTPIMPDSDAQSIEILTGAEMPYLKSFLSTLKLLPHRKASTGDTTRNEETRQELEKFIKEKARLGFKQRNSLEDSLVLLWTQLLFFVVIQHDTTSWDDPDLPQCDLLQMSMDNCEKYLQLKSLNTEMSFFTEYARAAQVSTMLARLYATSKGDVRDPIPRSFDLYLDGLNVLPRHIDFVVMATDALQLCLTMLPMSGPSTARGSRHEYGRVLSRTVRAYVGATGLTREDPLVREVEAFADLLSLRCQGFGLHIPAVVGPVANLTETIRLYYGAEVEANSKYIYNPLSMHTMTLTTLTLLELQQCRFDDAVSVSLVEDSLKEMKQVLSSVADRRAELDAGAGGAFWADKLLQMIDEMEHVRPANTAGKIEEEMVVEMSLLLQKGYGNVLVDYVTK